MPYGFRVQTVAIEGFKGFTTRKSVDFDGCHIFLLGRNGNGKSSIIEAVRWGLFGSAGRPNEVVANQNYSGQCRVEITLMRDDKLWKLRRTLNRGTTGGSDAELTDESGKEQSIREIMPQLDSVDAGEGMHIIFAPQSAPLRRQPEDLTAFERTVFNHLGLTHPRALLSHINDFLENQRSTESILGGELTDARTDIDRRVEEVRRNITNIVSSPPWGGGRTPTVGESENKTRELLTEITGSPPDQSLQGVSLEALIDSLEDALETRRIKAQKSLEDDASAYANRRQRVQGLLDIEILVDVQGSTIDNVQTELDGVLGGSSLDDLKEKVSKARVEAEAEALKVGMAKDALSLLSDDDTEYISCPLCESKHNRKGLTSVLDDLATRQGDQGNSKLRDLDSLLQRSLELTDALGVATVELDPLTAKLKDVKSLLDDEDSKYLEVTDDIDALVGDLVERESAVRHQLADQAGWVTEKSSQIGKLKDESRFHNLSRNMQNLTGMRNRFRQVEAAYKNFVQFGESVNAIKLGVETVLNEKLVAEVPGVSETLTDVFSALTQHAWYDQLVISKSYLPKLELRVASSNDPSEREHVTGVLNGQAESALALVPYFAFSQTEDAPTEVYLVLLDDPTRAFDVEHTEILISRMAELGKRVQLIVASQETARFEALLPDVFDSGSYITVEPTGWSHDNGPELDIRRG